MMKGKNKEWLSVLQWNADGLATELRTRLVEEDIDVLTVHERKLRLNVKTPTIHGYKAIHRADRRGGIAGGRLITYVKDSIVYEKGPAQIFSKCNRLYHH